MVFKPITPNHPYKTEPDTPEDSALSKHFQPTDAEWPLYHIQVTRHEDGFSLSVFLKRDQNSWWMACDYWNPIPFGLLGILTAMLSEFVWAHSFATFRQDLRQVLYENGVMSNPGWTEDDIVRAFRDLLATKKK